MIDSTHVKAHRSAAGGRGSRNRLLAARAEGATGKIHAHPFRRLHRCERGALRPGNRALRLRLRKAPFSICECSELSLLIMSATLAITCMLCVCTLNAVF